MYKRFSFIIIVCLLFSILTCYAADPDSIPASENVFMWQITQANTVSDPGTAYILGIPDIFTDKVLPFDHKIEQAYDACNKVIVNLDLGNVTEQQISASLLSYGFLDKTTLDKVIPVDTYKRADALIKKYTGNKKTLADYSRLKPWVVDSLLNNLHKESTSFNKYFIDMAIRDKKGILRLESVDYQYKLLGTLSYSVQNSLLETTVTTLEKGTDLSGQIAAAWQEGNSQILAELLIPDFGGNTAQTESYNYMLMDRNKHTADYVKNFLKIGGKYFILVDATQLLGQGSLLELLKAYGFQVEQL